MSELQGIRIGRFYDGGAMAHPELSILPSKSQTNGLPDHRNDSDMQSTKAGQKVPEHLWNRLVEQVEEANRYILNHHTHLEFSIHKETKEIIVRIIDSETQEVLKEIPPEKMLDLVAKLWEMAGLLIDERR